MTKIGRSPEYFNDLISIDEYYSVLKDASDTALRIIKGIEDAVERLSNEPLLGMEYCFCGVPTGYRYIKHGIYIIFYIVLDDHILIARAFDTRTDYISVLLNAKV